MEAEAKEKVLFDYSLLRGRIKQYYPTYGAFAKALGIARNTLSFKLNNLAEWSQAEISKACGLLEIEDCDIPKYFFYAISSETRTK